MFLQIEKKKWRFGQVSRNPNRQTDRQTLKDSATQLLRRMSGALVTQCLFFDHILFLDSHVLLINLAGGILYRLIRNICLKIFEIFLFETEQLDIFQMMRNTYLKILECQRSLK